MNYKNLLVQLLLQVALVAGLMHISHAQTQLENFRLIDSFENDKGGFKRDTVDVSDVSLNGGQAVFYHSKTKNYSVFDLQLFDETGLLHYLFYTDTKLNLKITKQTEQVYNKSKHKADFKEKETITYYSNEGKSFRVYDADRKQIKDRDKDKKDKIDKLFEILREKK